MGNPNENLSEKENNTQCQKPKTSKLAIWVLFLGVWSSCVLGIVVSFFIRPFYLVQVCIIMLKISALASIILGVFALFQMKYSRGKLIKYGLVEFGTIAAAVLVMFFAMALQHGFATADQMKCSSNLSALGKSMQVYKDNFAGKYPTPDKWCDLLMKHADVSAEQFVCPSAGRGRCHYAMNPNCEPNSPPDMVLLFETKGGWNQVGGPEVLTTDHPKGKGCWIVFNNGFAEFVKTEKLRDLKWRPEETK